MVLLIESLVLCIIFSIIVETAVFKSPIANIMSYPKAIRERVESLPQYKDSIQTREKKHIIAKILSVFGFAVLLAIIAYLSGAHNFKNAFIHVFLLFLIVNLWDTIVLDLIIFRHSKKVRIPGTEDMDKEYRDPTHHIVGCGKGMLIGTAVALLSGAIIKIFNIL